MTVIVKHDTGCPNVGSGHSDAAKRVYDTYHLHRTADLYGGLGKWFASALADGSSDGSLYDSKSDAIKHQHHNENYYTFIQISMENLTVCAAEVMLSLARRLYDAGLRMTDPEVAKRDVIKRASQEDQLAMVRGWPTNLTLPKE